MGVHVAYCGRFGNNLFQYSIGRLYAEDHGLQLVTDWAQDKVLKATGVRSGLVLGGGTRIIDDGNVCELFGVGSGGDSVLFTGYFQQSGLFYPHRDRVRGFFELPRVEKNTRDIVMHVRCDDYGLAHRIHPEWYVDILRRESYDRLYIVMSPLDQGYLDYFREFDPIIVSGNVRSDFFFISSFDRIICSNSTFAWWAAFFGEPSRVYTFEGWLPGITGLVRFENSVPVGGRFFA